MKKYEYIFEEDNDYNEISAMLDRRGDEGWKVISHNTCIMRNGVPEHYFIFEREILKAKR